ncbi:hypothetical protein EDC64_13010 [Aquabacter spiritensis]|uniref:T6SS Transcription factor RovC-like DNA binding domain-containing protein n=2 Tax=Aquabacter spiritensis TaxID=933073 RepID=A0A4R3LKX8_9HYPH|nr:hypothetical protein EDC64_13010 [Aquabacter spiritensis]
MRPTSRRIGTLWTPRERLHLSQPRPNISGGCDVPAKPSLPATRQPVHWSPRINPAVTVLTELPDHLLGTGMAPHAVPAEPPDHAAPPHLLLTVVEPCASIAALIPFDDDMPGRIEALNRLWHAQRGKRIPPDTRITRQQRGRLRLMLQACDGRCRGASYRAIAEVMFGTERVAADPWKTSPLRDRVIGLVEGGTGLIAGGYLRLFRHRRRA